MAIWAGIVLMAMNVRGPSALQNLPLYIPWTLLGAGAALTALSMSVLGASVIPPSILSLAIAVALGGWQSWQWWQKVSP